MPKNDFIRFWNLSEDASSPEVLNMYVYGEIKGQKTLFGNENDAITSAFVKDLSNHPNAEVINVYINSPGGEVFAANSVMRQLKAHNAKVNVFVDGLAASAATVIAMAGDVVNMSRSSLMMIHNPLTSVRGNAADMKKAIGVLNKVKGTLLATYKEKTGLEEDVLSALMDAESWLDADEALAYNFIDKIIEDVEEEEVDALLEDNEDCFQFKGVSFAFSNVVNPEGLKAKLNFTQENKTTNQGGNNHMSFEEFMATLTPEQQELVKANITVQDTTDSGRLSELSDKVDTLTQENAELKAQLATATTVTTLSAEETLLATMTEEAKALFLNAKAEAAAAQAAIAELENKVKFDAFKAQMSAYDNLPITEDNLSALFELSNFNKEYFDALEQILTLANNAIGAGFVPVGADGGTEVSDNAYAEIENRVAKLLAENPEMAHATAMTTVLAADPGLYERYRDGK